MKSIEIFNLRGDQFDNSNPYRVNKQIGGQRYITLLTPIANIYTRLILENGQSYAIVPGDSIYVPTQQIVTILIYPIVYFSSSVVPDSVTEYSFLVSDEPVQSNSSLTTPALPLLQVEQKWQFQAGLNSPTGQFFNISRCNIVNGLYFNVYAESIIAQRMTSLEFRPTSTDVINTVVTPVKFSSAFAGSGGQNVQDSTEIELDKNYGYGVTGFFGGNVLSSVNKITLRAS